MKKLTLFSLIAILAASLTGCGNTDTKKADAAEIKNVDPKVAADASKKQRSEKLRTKMAEYTEKYTSSGLLTRASNNEACAAYDEMRRWQNLESEATASQS